MLYTCFNPVFCTGVLMMMIGDIEKRVCMRACVRARACTCVCVCVCVCVSVCTVDYVVY